MNDIERQRELEVSAVSRGVDRYKAALKKNVERQREFDGTVGQRVVGQMMMRVVPAVRELQKDARSRLVKAQTDGRRLGGWEMAVEASDAYKMAYVTIRSVLTQSQRERSPKHQLARRIGNIINLELRWEELRTAERERAADREEGEPANRLEHMKRQVKQINPRSVRKWLRQLNDLNTTTWSNEVVIKVGLILLDLILINCDDFIEVRRHTETTLGQCTKLVTIRLRSEVRKRMDDDHAGLAEEAPWFLPMICPPRPWLWDGKAFTGGYLTHDRELIKSSRWSHTAAVTRQDTVPEECLTALRVIDKTAWSINSRVYEVARLAVERGASEVLPVAPLQDLPPDVSADEWAKMEKSERGKIKSERRRIHDLNNRLESKRDAMRRSLRVAEEFLTEKVIYFPHNLDFRGRAYPLPQDLHPQGDDFTRGLLMFSRSEALGATGLMWLMYHVASTYGEDKLKRDEQIKWVSDHLNDFYRVATAPLGEGYEFWSEAEEPWQFLASAIELERAFKHPEGPQAFSSRLPVFVDGSCNGLQHLSAMGLDPIGAHATNLTPDPQRQDIYQIVADKVKRKIDVAISYCSASADAARDAEPAIHWSGNVTRKTVKRGVMTVPYGLTDIGMRDQLITDRWTDSLNGDAHTNAAYLRDRMKEAIGDTVIQATSIMQWMQDNAHILASNNKPVDWTAPSGFRVRQSYFGRSSKTVRTLIGETTITSENSDAPLDVRKQVLSIVPNIIHSFDAAHMMLTIAAASREGFRDVAVVHDSFGCHASRMDDFLLGVRREFVTIYEQDWFTSLQAEFQAAVGPDVPLISPPERGDFDISQVNDAQFFFA